MSFNVNVMRLQDEADRSIAVREHPDECPVCRSGGRPDYLAGIEWDKKRAQLAYRCPRRKCWSMYIAYYEYGANATYDLVHREPMRTEERDFPSIIEDLSADFCKIANQAHTAEQLGLDEVAGVGYRKAIEFLVKDYLIEEYPEKEDAIRKKWLGACIKDHIEDEALRNCAQMASALGNDETHYERRWVDKDMEDLKHLIELTVQAIFTTRMRKQYEAEMLDEKQEKDDE